MESDKVDALLEIGSSLESLADTLREIGSSLENLVDTLLERVSSLDWITPLWMVYKNLVDALDWVIPFWAVYNHLWNQGPVLTFPKEYTIDLHTITNELQIETWGWMIIGESVSFGVKERSIPRLEKACLEVGVTFFGKVG